MDSRRLLLLSTSTVFGAGYLDYAENEVRDFFESTRRILFVPYALYDRAAYAEKVRTRFAGLGLEVESIHEAANPRQAVAQAEAIFIGGGNTFRLLAALYDFDLLGVIRERVMEGMPYLGSSAGSNVAAPTIRTTNDMPIVEPPSFEALGLVSFQINPHYVDPVPDSTHMGETRAERITQFLEENEMPVIGLREGAMLQIESGSCRLLGANGARLFQRGAQPMEVGEGIIDVLL